MWTVLTSYTKVLAPLIPFLTEEIYTNLTGEQSVHLTNWPSTNKSHKNSKLETEMDFAINLASAVHSFRKSQELKVRIPIKLLSYKAPSQLNKELEQIVLKETNVYKLRYTGRAKQIEVTGDKSLNNQDQKAGEAR